MAWRTGRPKNARPRCRRNARNAIFLVGIGIVFDLNVLPALQLADVPVLGQIMQLRPHTAGGIGQFTQTAGTIAGSVIIDGGSAALSQSGTGYISGTLAVNLGNADVTLASWARVRSESVVMEVFLGAVWGRLPPRFGVPIQALCRLLIQLIMLHYQRFISSQSRSWSIMMVGGGRATADARKGCDHSPESLKVDILN
ncbi:hypothetical protein WCLP8_4450001 [uncultured Gammaproteobacteria bacterium]